MKNPKPGGGKGSSKKPTAVVAASGGSDGRKSHWESSKNPAAERNAPSDPIPSKEDISGPSSGPTKPPSGQILPSATLPPAIHHLNAASSPPQPPYGFHNLERRTIILADGTARSYFALPPDYQMDPRLDNFFHPGITQRFDQHFPPPFGPDGFRDPPPPFVRGGADYWSSLGLEGPAGSSSLKRKYGEEDFAWHRQHAPQHGSSAANSSGFPSGPIGDGLGRAGSPSRKEHSHPHPHPHPHSDDLRMSKQIKLGGEGYDDLPVRRQRLEDNESSLLSRDVNPKALKDAFLRQSKTINESSTHRKNYLDDGKNGPLHCVACGRGGKEFANVHELIMHAYNYHQNPDSRIEHLGLHKALCVMMGWNYAKAPDSSKEYQSLSADEARANKDDLILWPPTVIIHNTNTGKRKDGRMDGLGNKEMDIKLKELGFGGGKAKSVYGKEGHTGVTCVKFLNNETALREAESLAEFLEKEDRGRRGWARVLASQSSSNEEKNPDLVKVDRKTGEKNRVFYGYLATAMDLDKVDLDVKKRAIIKSRKELDLAD